MLYLDYAKRVGDGYILNFFADSEQDLELVSNKKHFKTLNGFDYGIPLPTSTVVITGDNGRRKTFILGEDGVWVIGGDRADWDEENSTEPDYIKNRPFYTESKNICTFDVIKGTFKVGEKITVKYNNVYYTDTVQSFELNGDNVGEVVGKDPSPFDENQTYDDTEDGYVIGEEPMYYIGNGSIFGLEKRDFPFAFAPAKVLQEELEGYVVFFDNDIVKEVTKGDFVRYNEKYYEVKLYSSGTDLLYIGNLSKFDSSAENTGEDFLVFLNYYNSMSLNEESSYNYNKYILQFSNDGKFDLRTISIKQLDYLYVKDIVEKTKNDFREDFRNDFKEDFRNDFMTKKITIDCQHTSSYEIYITKDHIHQNYYFVINNTSQEEFIYYDHNNDGYEIQGEIHYNFKNDTKIRFSNRSLEYNHQAVIWQNNKKNFDVAAGSGTILFSIINNQGVSMIL